MTIFIQSLSHIRVDTFRSFLCPKRTLTLIRSKSLSSYSLPVCMRTDSIDINKRGKKKRWKERSRWAIRPMRPIHRLQTDQSGRRKASKSRKRHVFFQNLQLEYIHASRLVYIHSSLLLLRRLFFLFYCYYFFFLPLHGPSSKLAWQVELKMFWLSIRVTAFSKWLKHLEIM